MNPNEKKHYPFWVLVLCSTIIAIGLMLATALHGGIYHIVAGDRAVWIVNKFTGTVIHCDPSRRPGIDGCIEGW